MKIVSPLFSSSVVKNTGEKFWGRVKSDGLKRRQNSSEYVSRDILVWQEFSRSFLGLLQVSCNIQRLIPLSSIFESVISVWKNRVVFQMDLVTEIKGWQTLFPEGSGAKIRRIDRCPNIPCKLSPTLHDTANTWRRRDVNNGDANSPCTIKLHFH